MSKKKDAPPPRPPAPKLTLNKPSSRQGSIGAMAVHYNCLKEDDGGGVEDDVVFDPGTFSNASPAMKRISATNNTWTTQQKQSRSAPSSEATTPVSTSQRLIGQTSLDQGLLGPDEDATPDGGEKSLLFGLREKLNDPLNALIGKIEQISSDTVFADIVERNIKKSDSMDSTRSGTTAIDQTQRIGEMSNSRRNIHSASDSVSDEPISPVDGLPLLNSNIVDTSYSNDASTKNGTTELSENHRDSDQSRTSIKQGLSSPMTLSGLLLNSDENNLDDIPSSNDTESVFYDTRESLSITGVKHPPKRPDSPPHESTWSKLPLQKIIAAVVCGLAILVMFPFPSFVSGLLVGVAVTFCVFKLQRFLTEPSRSKEPFKLSDIETSPPMCMPEMRESKNEDGKFKGWMHEVSEYDLNDYHINQTVSVYLHLEGASLRLQRATCRVPRRVMSNESHRANVTFASHQRFLNLTDAQVSLLPKGIVHKRVWSKKYPILIELVASQQDSRFLDEIAELNSEQVTSDDGLATSSSQRLYLFARTPREKEEWYWRFVAAAIGSPLPTKMSTLLAKLESPKTRAPLFSPDAPRRLRVDSNDSDSELGAPEPPLSESSLLLYMRYMAHVMPTSSGLPRQGPCLCDPNLLFLNAFIARFFWDFLREKYWAGKIRAKIQNKLSKIHLPYFIDELTVTGIEIGSEMPVIRRSTQPFLNDRGLWSDLDITYNGGFRMCLETKVNLMKLKKSSRSAISLESKGSKHTTKGLAVWNSDEEDSGESSTDDEATEEKPVAETPDEKPGSSAKGKKLLKFVDKIAQSKYFQHVADYKYIRKAMEGVSNTRLVLTVELKSLSGTLAINIPPPPTDRLWYGFRTNPRLWLMAKPKVGDTEVNVSHITDLIEKKLTIEFQRVFVMPNMDDLTIPLMCSHIPNEFCHRTAATDDVTVTPDDATAPSDDVTKAHW